MFDNIWRLFSSTLAAFLGVQSDKNRLRDFNSNSPVPFIIMGIVLAVIFVATLLLIVKQVLA
ncbi:DUF2970 domain-containing protein [Shewanella sp. D64]|uniref:DUF2970 domain-containing protein n=1 Tax=unclassified Shewanella TaxID=196818 RepID=UPI0022BA189C|nr:MULTISPECIES: DUF2970 domain-containing protein [unclassified Shewanella]MEC4728485.1 DUF2970 domain-containing protein [Shewanella sp. D64]MEC4740483.1 DUF2970 domain-containing protein [Shewanella sp. E94]WBJ95148.1 DUF2970 domain-containing protein [Shewanella sp. MTB7]